MAEIFISYSNKDRPIAEDLAGILAKKGWSVWWDKVIPPGRTFDEVIEEQIDAAKCVMVLWSEESVKSQWVKTEATEGQGRNILIPVLVEDVKIPLAFRMVQAADLIGWQGKDDHPEVIKLIRAVEGMIGPGKLEKPSTEPPKKPIEVGTQAPPKQEPVPSPKETVNLPQTETVTIAAQVTSTDEAKVEALSRQDKTEEVKKSPSRRPAQQAKPLVGVKQTVKTPPRKEYGEEEKEKTFWKKQFPPLEEYDSPLQAVWKPALILGLAFYLKRFFIVLLHLI